MTREVTREQYNHAIREMAKFVALRCIESADDNGDDPITYNLDAEGVVGYLADVFDEVAKLLPEEIQKAVDLHPRLG